MTIPGGKKRQPAQLRDMLGNRVIEIERRIFVAPGVVAPIDDGPFAAAAVARTRKIGP